MANPRTCVISAFHFKFDPKFGIESLASDMAYRPLFWGFGTFITNEYLKNNVNINSFSSHKIIPRVQTNDREVYFLAI